MGARAVAATLGILTLAGAARGDATPPAAVADASLGRAPILEGADDARAIAEATRLGESREPGALAQLLGALDDGAPPRVQQALLSAIGKKHDPKALPLLARYARNRNPELRTAALAAVAQIADPRTTPLLLAALGDGTDQVRAAAIEILVKRRQATALPLFLELLARADGAVVPALVALATPDVARRVVALTGHIPDSLLCDALGGMLTRADFGPDSARVEVVRALSRVPGADSTARLADYLAATATEPQRPSHVEAQKVLDQRSGP